MHVSTSGHVSESPPPPSFTPTAEARPKRHTVPAPDLADFAGEVSPSSPSPASSSLFPATQPPAPHLSADHIWGVREDWGERARDWGRDAALYASALSPPLPLPQPESAHASGEAGGNQGGGDENRKKDVVR